MPYQFLIDFIFLNKTIIHMRIIINSNPLKLIALILISGLYLNSCQSNSKKKQLVEDGKELLKKELSKNEIDSINQLLTQILKHDAFCGCDEKIAADNNL